MLIEEAIVTHLAAQTAVTTLVSNRIYPLVIKQGEPVPAISYEKMDVQGHPANNATGTLMISRFRFDCWDRTTLGAKQLADKVRLSFDGYSGTISTMKIWGVLYLDEYDNYEPDSELFGVTIDFRIQYTA